MLFSLIFILVINCFFASGHNQRNQISNKFDIYSMSCFNYGNWTRDKYSIMEWEYDHNIGIFTFDSSYFQYNFIIDHANIFCGTLKIFQQFGNNSYRLNEICSDNKMIRYEIIGINNDIKLLTTNQHNGSFILEKILSDRKELVGKSYLYENKNCFDHWKIEFSRNISDLEKTLFGLVTTVEISKNIFKNKHFDDISNCGYPIFLSSDNFDLFSFDIFKIWNYIRGIFNKWNQY